MRRVRVIIVAAEKQYVLNIVVSVFLHLIFAILCCLWSFWLYHIFPHYLVNGMIFTHKMFNIKCVLLIIPTNQEDINVHLSSCEVPVILVRFFIKLEFSLQIFEKKS
jgi:hypothetical protein